MKKHLQSQRNYQWHKKSVYEMGKKCCKPYIYDKGLISKIYKNFYNLIMKKKEKPYTVTKWPKDLNRHFFKEDIQG